MKLGKWIGLAIAAVILAEGVWGILVSLTQSLLLPLLARVLGGDSHSPLYLGPGDINVPDLFASVLQLCLAGIVFLVIKSWSAKEGDVKSDVRRVRARKISEHPVAPAVPNRADSVPAAVAAAQAVTAPGPPPLASVTAQVVSPATPIQAKASFPGKPAERPVKPAKSEKPAKLEKPREVYYNIVGEPINPTEDE